MSLFGYHFADISRSGSLSACNFIPWNINFYLPREKLPAQKFLSLKTLPLYFLQCIIDK